MKFFNRKINDAPIRTQLFITVAAGIVLLLGALIFASTWISDRQVREMLIEQGKQATLSMADSSKLALLYDSPENAENAVKLTLAFPGVNHIRIYKADGSLFYASDTDRENIDTPDFSRVSASSQPSIFSEDEDTWCFISPVVLRPSNESLQEQLFENPADSREKLIGYVVVSSSKDSLKKIGSGILFSNFSIAISVGIMLLLALHSIIRRLTRPLYSISEIMKQTGEGELAGQIDPQGPQEITQIAGAFNRMISVLAERDEKLRRQNIHLEKQAVRDHLTGLINRVGFEQSLQVVIDECAADGTEHVLCYMDLDKFKIVNDSCGHNAGDELLKNITGIFRHHIRKDSDVLARVGGDEFALILKNCSAEKAKSIGESICEDIRNYRFNWEDRVFTIGVSIGIVQICHNTGIIQDLISQADSACYAAKGKGRGQVFVSDRDDASLQQLSGETRIANRIISCLENDDFLLLSQKIQPLKNFTQQKQQFEIMLRMNDEQGRPVPQQKLLSAAERYKLMNQIDRWVIAQTFSHLSPANPVLHTLETCIIDISASSLDDETLLPYIREQLSIHQTPPGLVCFSITETTTINNISKAGQFIDSIHQLGCRIALDDFVSNSSSFAYIRRMNIDFLKIHGDFFRDFLSNPVNQVMVRSINEIAHILKIKTIAEQIDDSAVLDELVSAGIDYAQGSIIAEPVSIDDCCQAERASKCAH